jgi:hypothetical protein
VGAVVAASRDPRRRQRRASASLENAGRPRFARNLGYVQDISTEWLDWAVLGPVVEQHRALIAADVTNTKITTTEAFTSSIDGLKVCRGRRKHLDSGIR